MSMLTILVLILLGNTETNLYLQGMWYGFALVEMVLSGVQYLVERKLAKQRAKAATMYINMALGKLGEKEPTIQENLSKEYAAERDAK